MVRHPEYPLYLRFAPGRSGPVDRQACSQSHSMSREHQVLHCWKDTGIADLLALAHPVQAYATVDYRGNLLCIPQHRGRIIVHFLHAASISGSTAQPLQPCSQHWFGESGLHFGVRTTTNSQGCALLPEVALVAALSIGRMISSGTGSCLNLRTDLSVLIPRSRDISFDIAPHCCNSQG